MRIAIFLHTGVKWMDAIQVEMVLLIKKKVLYTFKLYAIRTNNLPSEFGLGVHVHFNSPIKTMYFFLQSQGRQNNAS